MAAVGTMYRMKPLYDVGNDISFPDCMYKMDRHYPKPDWTGQESSPQSLEERQENLLKKLDAMIDCVSSKLGQSDTGGNSTIAGAGSGLKDLLQDGCPVDLVIRANPSHPPRWLGMVKKQFESNGVRTWWKYHTHSSVTTPPSPGSLPTAVPHEDRHHFQVIVTVIWSEDGQCPSLHICPSQRTPIYGETSIFRFFGRLLSIYDTSSDSDAIIDMCLEACDVMLAPASTNQEKASILKSISAAVDKGSWFRSSSPLLAGFLASVLSNYGVKNVPQESLKQWMREHASQLSF